MTGLAFIFGVLPMVIAAGASAKSQQALGTGVMGGMIAVVVLALIMVAGLFVVVQSCLLSRPGDAAETMAPTETMEQPPPLRSPAPPVTP